MSGFRQGIQATIPALRRYARALTRDAEAADDLVQDTLVRALRSEHLFHGGDIRSWLYTILTNLNRNRLRSLARRPVISPIEDNDVPDASGSEGGARDIARALASLVEDQRVALLLVVLEGLSYREVAEVQGVPIGTVMSRLARARAQIKAYLDGDAAVGREFAVDIGVQLFFRHRWVTIDHRLLTVLFHAPQRPALAVEISLDLRTRTRETRHHRSDRHALHFGHLAITQALKHNQ